MSDPMTDAPCPCTRELSDLVADLLGESDARGAALTRVRALAESWLIRDENGTELLKIPAGIGWADAIRHNAARDVLAAIKETQ